MLTKTEMRSFQVALEGKAVWNLEKSRFHTTTKERKDLWSDIGWHYYH